MMQANQQIQTKVENYCAYQERSQQEVRDKLYSLGLHQEDVEQSIVKLIEDGFLNEERFAKAFTQGKHRMKKWGRFKIKQGLQQKSVSEPLIRIALQSLDDMEYRQNLEALLRKKSDLLAGKDAYIWRTQLLQFAYMKGYEKDLAYEIIESWKK